VPFPIQAATIADAMAGKDVLGKARTGSGKTLAFGLPILARIADLPKPGPHQVHALVLVPTRELAMQVGDALEPYAHATQLTYRLVAGGLSMSKQIMAVDRGVHLVVATPGRLADLVRRGHIDLSETSITVLDEADHMAEMGFGEEIAEILDKTPSNAQRLLFSATLDGVVDDIVKKYMHNPVLHDVTDGSAAPTQRHVMISIPPHEKYKMATRMAARNGRTMCFVRTKLAADRIAADMRANGVLAVALHGDRSQVERNFVMVEFRAGRLPVLVATDVAARGIHVDAVDLVIQIDPPADYRDYTHRSGRTGRAGADGLAVMLVLPHQRNGALRILESAGIDAEDAAFRTVDAAALAKIDALTGAQQPSGVPVEEPMPVMRSDRRGGGRGGRPGGDSRSGRERPSRDRPSRDRPVRGRAGSSDDSGYSSRLENLSAKERELADRERALAAREQQLTRPASAPARVERTERTEHTSRPERGAGYQGNRDDSRGTGGRPSTGYQGNRDDAPRTSTPPQSRVGWAPRKEDPRGNFRGRDDRGSKPSWGNRDDSRSTGGRPSGYQGNRDDSRGTGGRPSTGYQGNRDDSRGTGGRPSTGYQGNRDDSRTSTGYQGNRDDSRSTGGRPSTGYQGNRDDSRSTGGRPSGYQGNRDDSRSSGGRPSGYQGNRDDSRSSGGRPSGYQGNRDDSRSSGGRPSTGYQGNRDDRGPRRDDAAASDRTSAPRYDSAPAEKQPGHGAAHKSKNKKAGRQPPGSRRGKARPKKND